MIHNNYFEILKLFTGNYQLELYGRQLVNKVPMSQKGIALVLTSMEKDSILKSRKQGSLKMYSLNTSNPQIKEHIIMAELQKKAGFLSKNKKIAHLFKSDNRIVGLFGSYAKGTQEDSSDIDLFIIGGKKKEDYDSMGKKYDLEISIKYFDEKEFKQLLKQKNTLVKEMINNHILIFNVEKFISFVWEDYYALD